MAFSPGPTLVCASAHERGIPMRPVIASCLLALLLPAIPAHAVDEATERLQRATRLARDALLVDTHIDVPYRLEEGWADVTRATPDGEFDHPRALAGGLD